MPPLVNSRYFQSRGKRTEDGVVYLAEPNELDPKELFDGSEDTHIVEEGESLQGIAARYWTTGDERPNDPGPESWWWIIAQLNDIMDATLTVEPGTVLLVPSLRIVKERILNR